MRNLVMITLAIILSLHHSVDEDAISLLKWPLTSHHVDRYIMQQSGPAYDS